MVEGGTDHGHRDDALDIALDGAGEAAVAAAAVRGRLEIGEPAAAIILGSGLGGLAGRLESVRRLSFADIPGFPAATVAGHAGALMAGTLAGREVLALAGRFHLYEGHPASLAALPVRLLRALGARTLIVSNAAGGVRRTFRRGDLMLIHDHINLMARNPLVGVVQRGDVRFPDMSAPYDPALLALLRAVAAAGRIPVVEGVYLGLLGPSYETPAEVRMLERLGADAVGMSTVPEVIVARALGMRVAGISCITNLAAGISAAPLDHAEVLETTRLVGDRFERLVEGLVARL
ncbi:MAG: purine-nucleoside phosphorylase [Gemmatimonadaceae bacterium]